MIEAKQLTKVFDGKRALDSVDLKIGEGSIYGLVGSNGSGKSTLLRLISGVYMPDGGEISVDGGEISVDGEPVFNNVGIKSRIAYLGDTPYFLPGATINETAKFCRRMYPAFDNALFNRFIEIFPLDYKARIATMSKGMQRQAALITAVSVSPKYLLLDEAFDGLDVVMRKTLKGILIEGAENRDMTTVIASHNVRELEDLCDCVGLVHNGRILFNDEVGNLLGRLHKLQAAFSRVPELTAFSGLDVLKTERSGSLVRMIVRGDEEEILSYVNRLSPIFAECVEPSLEEIFVYELEVNGYDSKNITE